MITYTIYIHSTVYLYIYIPIHYVHMSTNHPNFYWLEVGPLPFLDSRLAAAWSEVVLVGPGRRLLEQDRSETVTQRYLRMQPEFSLRFMVDISIVHGI